ncbi:ATP-binding protein [Tundrisphaera sp. TA3]|uniref:ATP-binding protein n=1 Tax=Tundrisphaera sp. TA3 TaxID=3435775 RepID=UPI003EC147AA
MSTAFSSPKKLAKRPTLVVVDDEPEVLRSLHDLFRLDYKVLTYERPAEALSALEQAPEIDVIMSDQRMPEMTGVAFLGKVKKLHPDATRLLFTGYADIRAVIDAINQGNIFRYVTKPWDAEELATVIRQAVDQHALIVEKNRLLRELTETNQRLMEADRLKGKFIEVASHELNTPVTVVLGLAELWKMTQSPDSSPAERNWVDRIHGAGRRLATTVERMLKLLKTDQIAPGLATEEVELRPLLVRALADVGPFLEARRQQVDFRAADDLGTAEVDPAKLADVVTNLVVNAIKFTPDGGTIIVEARGDDPERFYVRVTDPGVGIPPEDRAHLFEPFFTGNDTLHHSSGEYQYCKKGMGLGLCLVKTFVELHGGTVGVDSAPGEGSTFLFSLPRRQPPAPGAKPGC